MSKNREKKTTITTTPSVDGTHKKHTKTFTHGQHTLRSYSDRCVSERSRASG
jgi:hypothetical protein